MPKIKEGIEEIGDLIDLLEQVVPVMDMPIKDEYKVLEAKQSFDELLTKLTNAYYKIGGKNIWTDNIEQEITNMATPEETAKSKAEREKREAQQRILNDLGPEGGKARRVIGQILNFDDETRKAIKETLIKVEEIKEGDSK